MFEVGQVVTSLVDKPGEGVRLGDVGTVVFRFTSPREAYEVEFLDEEGYTKAVTTLEAEDISTE